MTFTMDAAAFGLPKIGISIDAEVCGVLGLTLLGGAYMAESFRSGLESIEPIQTESALRLLTQAGYLLYEEEVEYASRLTFTVRRDELYRNYSESADQEVVIRTLLRLYTGIFTDYVFIDEKYLARKCGFDDARLFEVLIGL
ncbi:MAG: hypothetical protein ACSW8D_16615, partial [Prevotella sp.]